MIQKSLIKHSELLDKVIEQASDRLACAPSGSLRISQKGPYVEYYRRLASSDTEGAYLPRENTELVRALAQKTYDRQIIRQAEKEKRALDRLIEIRQNPDHENALVQVYDRLSPLRKSLISPFFISDAEYAEQWSSAEYHGKDFEPNSQKLFTMKGERVRSKSEIIIADRLAAANVPYRYEYPVEIDGFNLFYPDFTVLNKRTRQEYIWEHFGIMDDESYMRNAFSKIMLYQNRGFFLGKNFLATFESRSHPLDSRHVDTLIEEFLL